jgi:hypothetical protein
VTRAVETYCSILKFTISVSWPDADVDAVYCELGGMFQSHTLSNNRTPTDGSVEVFLGAVSRDPELKARDIDARTFDSLMMGCCAVEFEVSTERIEELPELIRFAEQRMRFLRRKYVRYHREGKHLTGCAVQVVTH